MLRSMTAYGCATIATPLGRFTAEIQSVNRKFLEVEVSLPRELKRFEADVKEWVTLVMGRGRVDVRVGARFEKALPVSIKPNTLLAEQLGGAWEEIAGKMGWEKRVPAEILAQWKDLFLYEEDMPDPEPYRQALKEAVQAALKQAEAMKCIEGEKLTQDIEKRFLKLRQLTENVAVYAPQVAERYREKIMERLESLLPGHLENQEKILREVAVFADRIDITEELTRIHSHLDQVKTWNSGKTLEFLLQELNREITTIGSKTSAKEVIEFKSELDKIREQLQNVE